MTAHAAPALVAVNCAACGRPLTDELSATLAIGPECRAGYDYKRVSTLGDDDRQEVHRLLHTIAGDYLKGADLRAAIFRVAELGFQRLAQRIERRVGRQIVEAELAKAQQEIDFTVAKEEEVRAAETAKALASLPFTLTDGQNRARDLVNRIHSKHGFALGFVVGFAGTGKTSLLKVFAAEHGPPVVVTPTGKAALRVREATGLQASTIHRWLYRAVEDEKTGVVKFVRRQPEDVPLTASRMVVLDEASMVGPDVWKDVYGVCKQLGVTLVVVGDGFQLPPVQAPNTAPFSVLPAEFAAQLGAERVEMTEVVRQAQGSPVIRASMALRNGEGIRAVLRDLPRVETAQLAHTVTEVYRAQGVTICHRNATRFSLNAGIRQTFGIFHEMPQPGEPLLVLKNTYEAGVVNGESFTFEGWQSAREDSAVLVPSVPEQISDHYKDVRETARFGATSIGKVKVTLALEELHGRLAAGPKAISIAAGKWARLEGLLSGDTLAPHVHANFGYCYTAHKAQGSQWPYVLVILEPSVRLDEEDGRRWLYTSVTRAQTMAAIHLGRV